ncbi:type IV toxin-antitoxin system AbiEi family antitoxin [Achromobacter xylosoxidans]|uniref:type IV toxin-antitoxin system AbiEi family antitoxin n=1 Tax=Alcaligenes xylosoxydans xylosoxydans TaxID=85698 RepID=UPI000B490840|nr:type IV toxin-antitoxin system AbiEi family antitoxin [Achromobacter xylosoxidans]
MKINNPVKIGDQAASTLQSLLEEIPAVEHLEVDLAPQNPGSAADLAAELTAFGNRYKLVGQVQSSGQPRHVRSALLSLRDYVARQSGQVTPILIAPYLSPQAQALCRDFGVAYLDFEGNARLAFATFFVSRQVAKKPVMERRGLRSLFKPKSVQVLKLMLREPSRAWRVAELAKAADVSLGHVSNVRNSLLDREWVELGADGMFLSEPNALVDAWREAYEPPAGQRLAFYTSLHGTSFDVALRGGPPDDAGRIALASFSAARWLAPFVRTGTHYFYADAAGLELLRTRFKLATADKGENLVVTVLDDPGLFLDTVQPAPGVVCTSPVQTYLDLGVSGERGQEAADHLRRKRFEWHQ